MVTSNSNPGILNLAAFCPETYALGPGVRAAVWVQGCPFHCPNCIAPDWIPQIKANLVEPEVLARKIIVNPSVTGITLSGGEPMLQAHPLAELIRLCKQSRDFNVIVFTGFRYESLLQKTEDIGVQQLLGLTDVLIDGPYIQAKNDGIGLRGSANQRIIYLTDRLKNYSLETFPRQIEYHFTGSETLIVGIPPLHWSHYDIFEKIPNQGGRVG